MFLQFPEPVLGRTRSTRKNSVTLTKFFGICITRPLERSQLGFRQVKRAQGFLDLHARITNLHGSTRSTVPADDRRSFLSAALRIWKIVVQQVA